MARHSIKRNRSIPFLIFALLMFQPALEIINSSIVGSIFSYFDEFLTIAFIFVILYYWKKGSKYSSLEKIVIKCWLIYLIVCSFSSIVFHYQRFFPSVLDAISSSKFFVAFIACSLTIRHKPRKYDPNYFMRYNSVFRFLSVMLFVLEINNLFIFRLFPNGAYRYFTYSQKLFFPTESSLADVGFYLLCLLILNYKKKNIVYMILASIVTLLTFRAKQMAAIAVVWIFFIYIIKLKQRGRLAKRLVMLASIIIAIYIGYDTLSVYFSSEGLKETARGVMLVTSVKIANDHIPLGSGFATFGSGMSANYYSPLYYMYNVNNIYGMNSFFRDFLNDSFWPIVIAQAGWIGLLSILAFFISLIREVFKKRNDSIRFVIELSLLAYLVFVSLGTTCLFNACTMICAILLAFLFNTNNEIFIHERE